MAARTFTALARPHPYRPARLGRIALRTVINGPGYALANLRDAFDPRTHDAGLRIRRLTPGGRRERSGHWLLFVTNTPSLPSFLRCVPEAAARAGINLATITNRQLPPGVRTELAGLSTLFIERDNVGRDFGGFKDALALLPDSIDGHLLLFNDSVAYDPRGIDSLIRRMLATEGFCALTENVCGAPHGQSYALGFAPRAHRSAAFRAFWSGYQPLNEKAWVVRQGEIRLSHKMHQAGFPVSALWRPEQLGAAIDAGGDAILERALAMLPGGLRRRLARAGGGPAAAAALVEEVLHANPVSVAGFAYALLCGLPVIKRNLIAKRVFTAAEIARALDAIGHPCRDEILADFAAREAAPAGEGWGLRALRSMGAL